MTKLGTSPHYLASLFISHTVAAIFYKRTTFGVVKFTPPPPLTVMDSLTGVTGKTKQTWNSKCISSPL